MTKVAVRRAMIKQLIDKRPVRTQGELGDLLAEKGIDATQTTLSRDIDALGLIKVNGYYRGPDNRVQSRNTAIQLAGRILGVKPAGPNLVVIHTRVGEASMVGLGLDRAGWPELTGTLAGDDTVFAAFASKTDSEKFIVRLKEIAPEAFI